MNHMKPLNIPTMLTLGRIAVIPLICLAYWLPWHHAQALAAALFALASFTDWLDGYLARYWGQATALGAFLDPVADKILVSSVLVMIAASQHTLWIALPSAVIIGREIVISALREWMAEVGQRTSVAVSAGGG